VTGIFFDEQTPESLIAAMEHFERAGVTFGQRKVFTDHVQQFSKTAFIERMRGVLEERKRI
jgi:hypothetical protein